MDPQQHGNQKWVRQYEKIEAKATANLAFCMQNLLREAYHIPSRDELKSNRMRLEQRLAEQKRREHEMLYERWEAQNRANMEAIQQQQMPTVSAPGDDLEERAVDHTRTESTPEPMDHSLCSPPAAAPSACTD